MKSKVAVIRSTPDTAVADIARACEAADMKSALDSDTSTILKDNISWHFPFLSANTTPWQLEGTIQALRGSGFDDLVAVHNDTVVTNPDKGQKLCKLKPVYEKYNVPERYNCRKDDLKWIRYEPKGEMLVLPRIFPDGIQIPEFFQGKNIVHLPTVKTHIYTTTTGAMKNAFGGLLNTRRHYTHSHIHKTLVDLLTIQKEIHTGLFCVKDGTLCGNGPGPRTMFPVEKNLFLASSDMVAIDAVAARLMGFEPMDLEYIALAHERGLGCGRTDEIEIVGEDISGMNFQFSVGDNFASHVGDFLWFGPLKSIQYLFFHTPIVYFFVFGSYFYHDFFWWPLFGKSRMRKLRKESSWATFFDSYPE